MINSQTLTHPMGVRCDICNKIIGYVAINAQVKPELERHIKIHIKIAVAVYCPGCGDDVEWGATPDAFGGTIYFDVSNCSCEDTE